MHVRTHVHLTSSSSSWGAVMVQAILNSTFVEPVPSALAPNQHLGGLYFIFLPIFFFSILLYGTGIPFH